MSAGGRNDLAGEYVGLAIDADNITGVAFFNTSGILGVFNMGIVIGCTNWLTGGNLFTAICAVSVAGVAFFFAGCILGIPNLGVSMGTGQGSTAGIAGGVAVGVLMTGGADFGTGSDFLTTVFAVGITGVTVSGAGGVLFATDLGLCFPNSVNNSTALL